MAHKPAASKRAKPSFEIPSDAGNAESAAGWVFRETETLVEPIADVESKLHAALRAAPVSSREKSASDEVLATATEVFVLSATSVGFATLAALRLLEVPFVASKMILPNLKRSV
jgi:hypothetical protein